MKLVTDNRLLKITCLSSCGSRRKRGMFLSHPQCKYNSYNSHFSLTSHIFVSEGPLQAFRKFVSSPKNIPHPHAELLKTKSCGVYSQSGFCSALNLGDVPPLRFIQNGCAPRLICIRINSWLPQPLYRPRQGRADCD